jgi:argininosuccinate synthase
VCNPVFRPSDLSTFDQKMAITLAFSGGLDTSFCIPHLRETYGEPVRAVTVNTGGTAPDEALRERAFGLGAEEHIQVDAREALFEDHLSYLIKGNVLRGDVYPLCVGPERVVQARKVAEAAREAGARAVAHGSTGAGNDQVRFDVALRLLTGDDLEVLAPIRSNELSREETTRFLEERGHDVPADTTAYSINRGLWGTTVGGRETHTPTDPLPDDAYPDSRSPEESFEQSLTFTVRFEEGRPVALDGEPMAPVALIERLNKVGGAYGIGRDIHVGDTILGIKGRVGFEAPAARILITAHRELEKIVLTKWQRYQKDQLGDFYGMLLHEADYFDPVMRDVEAFLDSSQETVTGTATVKIYKGNVHVQGCESRYSMFDAGGATYGEEHARWDGRDAEGFTRLAGLQAELAQQARSEQAAAKTSSTPPGPPTRKGESATRPGVVKR